MKIEEVKDSLSEWEFLTNLPREIGDFKLKLNNDIKGQILKFATYENEEKHCRLELGFFAYNNE